ncbi:winged helix-turn-helix transcriptional regulator [Streptomyces sp. JW3]|uniref:winged helix-turn-helix transcriptional regulator n=1 Tax=Streptomyces sp. JW3 TaxID=3456955 RepID=UPI003FA43FA3
MSTSPAHADQHVEAPRSQLSQLATTEQICALRRDVLGHVGSKWSSLVLIALADGPRRYSELRRSSRISQRMLTLTLQELQRDGLIARTAAPDAVTARAYALTAAGRSLSALVTSLIEWADEHHDHILGSRTRFDDGAAPM